MTIPFSSAVLPHVETSRTDTRDVVSWIARSPDALAAGAALLVWALSALSAPWTGWVAPSPWPYAAALAGWAVVGAGVRFAETALRIALRRRRAGRPAPGRSRLAAICWRRAGGWRHVGRVALALVAVSVTVTVFTGWKVRLPHLVPFFADAALAEIGRTLHGGRSAIEWLAPLFEHAWLIRAIDTLYYAAWGATCLLAFGAVASAPRSRGRTRALVLILAVFLVLGVAAAYLGSSAGPWFVAMATHEVPASVAPRMPYLAMLRRIDAVHPLFAVQAADHLLAAASTTASAGAGISAFPSMHVALITTAAVAARAVRCTVACVLATLLVPVVLVGSVVLGMHYAVDGYAALLGVAALWWVSGRAVPE